MGTELRPSPEECDSLFRVLRLVEPDLDRLRQAHEHENGEFLITVFLGEVAKWCFETGSFERVTEAVNELLIVGSLPVRNVLLTGFVEGIPMDTAEEVVVTFREPLRSEIRVNLGT